MAQIACRQCRYLTRSSNVTAGSLVNQFQAASGVEKNKSNPEKALLTKSTESNPSRKVHIEGSQQAVGGLAEAFQSATLAKQEAAPARPAILCRTAESNPLKHNKHHHGLFYTVPAEEHKNVSKGHHPHIHRLARALGEMSFMVRQPGLELAEYMNAASHKLPVIRYMLHGRWGSGKSCTVSYAMHTAAKKGWLLLHIPWAQTFSRYSGEITPSGYKPGRFDQNTDAVNWLSYFRELNADFLKQHEVKTCHKYVWNRRESTEEGTPLLEAIEFGVTRPKYACDVLGLIIKEVKAQASDGQFQVLVAMDGVNAFWTDTLRKREEDRTKKIHASEMSVVHNFKKLLRNDWCGGAVVCTVDKNAGEHPLQESDMPRYLLGKEGFEFFDPHVPIHVGHYDNKEVNSHLDYYTENRWIQNPAGFTEAGRKEMIFLSCHNPFELFQVTMSW